jgi:hypothetical protein
MVIPKTIVESVLNVQNKLTEMSEIDQLVQDFFNAPQNPVTTHEEWLLRLCAKLMEREAATVSILEKKAKNTGHNIQCKRLRENSNVSTEQSTEMQQTSTES